MGEIINYPSFSHIDSSCKCTSWSCDVNGWQEVNYLRAILNHSQVAVENIITIIGDGKMQDI